MSIGVLVLALAAYAAAQDTLLDIRIQPAAKEYKNNEKALITCFYPNWITGLKWRQPNGALVTNRTEGFTLEKDDGKLYLGIQSVKEADAGLYQCEGTNVRNNETVSTNSRITVYVPIDFVNPMKKQAFEQGKTVTVKCNVSGNPKPVVVWKKGSEKFDSDKSKRVYQDASNSLVIQNITKPDEGDYTCTGREFTKGQEISLDIFVDVQYAPVGIQLPTLVKGKVGENISIVCDSEGEPKPTFRWYRGASESEENLITENVSLDGTLTLVNINQTNSGEYTCVGQNRMGKKSNTTRVQVNVPPRFVELNNASVTENVDASISCVVQGAPRGDVKVYRNGELLENGKIDQKVRITVDYLTKNKATINFRPVEVADDGHYECVISTEAGYAKASITLDVLYGPRDPYVPNAYACVGTTVSLPCSFEGKPSPSLTWGQMSAPEEAEDATASTQLTTERTIGYNDTIKWFLRENGGKVVDPTETPVEPVFVPIETSNNMDVMTDMGRLLLKIATVEQSSFGNYYCKAVNDYGTQIQATKLIEASKPRAPTNITVSDVGTQRATVTFSPPAEVTVPIISYTVEARPVESGGASLVADVESDNIMPFVQLSHTFTKLEHNTTYRIYVKAQNCKGEGKNARSRRFVTEVITKPGRAAFVKPSEPMQPTSYSVQWKMGSTGGGKISKVEVSYWPVSGMGGNRTMGSADEVVTVTYLSSDKAFADQKFDLTDLKPETTYIVKLTVTNQVGSTQSLTEFKTPPIYQETTTNSVINEMQTTQSDEGGQELELYTEKRQLSNMQTTQTRVTEEQVYIIDAQPMHQSTAASEHPLLKGKGRQSGTEQIPHTEMENLYNTVKGRIFLNNASGNETEPTEATTTDANKVTTANALIIGVIVAVALILLIIIDISCCISRKCGLTHFIYINTCGASKKDSKTLENKDLEEGSAEYRQEHGVVNEETPLNDEQVLNGEKPTTAETPLVANEQETPANTPMEAKLETKEPVKPDDVTVAVGDAEKPRVQETSA